MGESTGIEWCDSSWNPVSGCTKVSAGCDHCYAENIAERFRGGKAYPNGFAVTLHPHRLNDPAKWKNGRRIFVCSMSDLFHKDIPDDYIRSIFDVMMNNDQHTYQILTKRPQRMVRIIRDDYLPRIERNYLPHNIWCGVSVENEDVKWRIDKLKDVPVATRFISAEPLLGPLNLDGYWPHIDWLIVGGESGRGYRNMEEEWANQLMIDAKRTRTPFFMKQMAGKKEIPSRLLIREFP